MSKLNEDLLRNQDVPNLKNAHIKTNTKTANKLPLAIGGVFLLLFLMVVSFLVIQKNAEQNRKLEIASKDSVISNSKKQADIIIKQISGLIEPNAAAQNANANNNNKFEYTTINANQTHITNPSQTNIVSNIKDLSQEQKADVLAQLKELAKTDPALAAMLEGLTDEQILQLVATSKLPPVVLKDGTVFGNKSLMAIKANAPKSKINTPIFHAQNQKPPLTENNELTAADAALKSTQAKRAADIRKKYPALNNWSDADLIAMQKNGELEEYNNAAIKFDLTREEELDAAQTSEVDEANANADANVSASNYI